MKRGEVWIVNLEPGFASEIQKVRPALIISNDSIHHNTPYVIIVPASTQVPSKFGIEMVLVGKKEGLDKESVLLPVLMRSIDKVRLMKKIGKVSKLKLQEVEATLKIVLDLEQEDSS